MSQTTKVYPKGFYIGEPNENAPDFVKGRISVKVEEFTAFLNENTNDAGYVNLDLLEGQKGLYSTLNTWKPKESGKAAVSAPAQVTQEEANDLPF